MIASLLYWIVCILVFAAVACISYLITKNVFLHSVKAPEIDLGDPDSERHGGELVAKVLKDHGVKALFTLTGGHISPILVAAKRCGIKVIDTRHEVTAVFAADAYARLSGEIGVAAVTAGPGLTNTVTAVKNAQMAGSAVLVLSGAAAIALKGRGALQDIDQLALMRSLCKYTVSVSRVKDIIPSIRKAIQKSLSGLPGPVFVELPLDVLYPYSIVAREVQSKQNSRSLIEKIIRWYSNYYLSRLFDGASSLQCTSPLAVVTKDATNSQVKSCMQLLQRSEKPLLLIGSQALHPAVDCFKVSKAVENLGIPCYLSGMARGLLGKTNKLLFRQKRREALCEADLIILAGVSCDFRLSYGKDLNRKAKVIAVNLDKDLLFKNSKVFWNYTIAINASVSDFLIQLAASSSQKDVPTWMSCLCTREKAAEESISLKAKTEMGDHLNSVFLLSKLEEHINENTIIVADGGDFVGTASYILRPPGPLKWLDPGPFGTLGVGAGFAIGAKLFSPSSNVIIIYGDGSLGYSIIEFDTFIRHNLPVIAVVGNDACWGQIEREQVPMFSSDVACKLRYADYDKVAVALGANGSTISGANKQSISSVFEEAFRAVNENKSVLINALIGKSDFRAGSISV